MIVRCSNCDSAFAVDDGKVKDKRFAFTCPKCTTENIIDNRKGEPIADTVLPDTGSSTDTVPDFFDESPGSDTSSTADTIAAEAPAGPEAGIATDISSDMPSFEEPVADTSEGDDFSADIPLDDMELTADVPAGEPEIDDLEVDLGDLDADIDLEAGGLETEAEIPAAITDIELDEPVTAPEGEPDDLDLDLDGLDDEIDLEGGLDSISEDSDEISLGLDDETDSLDIPSAEPNLSEPGDDVESVLLGAEDIPPDEESLDLTIDDMDMSLDEMEAAVSEAAAEDGLSTDFEPIEQDVTLDDEIVTEEVYTRSDTLDDEEDESITIDLDSLDIELEEGEEDSLAFGEEKTVPAALSDEAPAQEDDDVTLDLDSLDIELAEEEAILPGETPEDLDIDLPELSPESVQPAENDEEDESITLDLETLDIELAESDEFASGELPEEDESITLEDAGLTIDELTSEELEIATASIHEEDEEEDIHLSIDEIDPNLKHELENELRDAEDILTDADSDLPDIDFDLEDPALPMGGTGTGGASRISNTAMGLDDSIDDISGDDHIQRVTDSVQNGAVEFSIDYSLKYSRLGALARLFFAFLLGMIPHFLVLMIYSLLAGILGFINHIVVISTKNSVEDFSEIIENTIRYSLAINTACIGIVEEMPIFTGKKDIDYAMQMKITYPLAYSRFLAAMRLSGIGIILMTLPHILVLSIIGIAIPIFWLTGIISVLATSRWPHFLFDILVRYYRYMARTMAFITGLVDKYPPFTF